MGNPVFNDRQLEYFPRKHPFNKYQNVIATQYTVNSAFDFKGESVETTLPSSIVCFVIDDSKWQ